MRHEKCVIVDNINLSSNLFLLRLESIEISRLFHPGQFVLISFGKNHPLSTPRPFSPSLYISSHKQNQASQFEIIYKRYGEWTEILSSRATGHVLSISGPLGRGFNLDVEKTRLIMIAGGTGVTPLLASLQKLREIEDEKGIPKNRAREIQFLIGARTARELLYIDTLQELASEILISTDDGSCGFKGSAADLLCRTLDEVDDIRELHAYSAGPKGMMREILKIVSTRELSCEVSLETIFNCGVGICGGCIVSVKNDTFSGVGCAKVCTDGPVFDASIIESIDML